MVPADLPLLGEPFAVELANTLDGEGARTLDHLGTVDALRTWFAHAPDATTVEVPADVAPSTLARCRAVRDAARTLLATSDVDADALAPARDVLNRACGAAAARAVLAADRSWRLEHDGPPSERFVAAVATRCVRFAGGPDAPRVRRCSGVGCTMLFVARHRARRFCHDSCSHAARQARYHRSRQGEAR